MKIFALILTISLSPFLLSAAVETGAPAADFTLTDSNGTEHSLSDFEGQFVVLEWLNHGCPFVVRHYESGNLPELQKSYTEKGAVWLSIVSSAPGKQGYHSPEDTNKMSKEKGANPTAVLLDPTGKVGKAYGAQTTPHMYVINPEGVLIYQGAIDDDPRGRKGDDAKCYVSAALDSAMNGETVETGTTKPYGCSVKY